MFSPLLCQWQIWLTLTTGLDHLSPALSLQSGVSQLEVPFPPGWGLSGILMLLLGFLSRMHHHWAQEHWQLADSPQQRTSVTVFSHHLSMEALKTLCFVFWRGFSGVSQQAQEGQLSHSHSTALFLNVVF